MTIAKVLFIAAILALITFGPLLFIVLSSRPTISSFGRRHRRAIYLVLTLLWAAMAALYLASESAVRGVMIALSVVNVSIYAAMWFLHPQDSGRVDSG